MLDENINNGEQPNISSTQTVATDDIIGVDKSEGSPLGKFKDANKLLDAYNELQSEFTRKCQKLSEAEKKLQETEPNNTSQGEVENNEFAWNNKINEFLQSHKNAKSLVEDITNEIINDKNLRDSDDGLEKAYSRVIEKKYIPENELVTNQDFLDKYIFNNETIKNKIIKEYVSSLKNTQSPITINNAGFNRGVAHNAQINTLEDAKKYVENMFKF